MANVHSLKFWLANYAADHLNPIASYSKEQVEQQIAALFEREVFSDPTLAVDHIRMEMLERGFIRRDADGRAYRRAETFVSASDSDEEAVQKLAALAGYPDKDGFYLCPNCRERFKERTFVRHFLRTHTHLRQGDWLIKYLKPVQ